MVYGSAGVADSLAFQAGRAGLGVSLLLLVVGGVAMVLTPKRKR